MIQTEQTLSTDDVQQLHIILQLLQRLDNGLVLLDNQYRVQLWNSFMETHSGIKNSDVRNQNLFSAFPELPQRWLQRKIDSVFKLHSPTFCTWEEHPRLFNFTSTRPLTGASEQMYQNVTLLPLHGLDGQVSRVCLLIYDVTEIATRKAELEAANTNLKKLSRIDRLTGVYNRGYWEECLEQEFIRCQRNGRPASLLLFDIDHFKNFNDEYGHQAGDEVLRSVGALLGRYRRSTDTAGRYGGEEFAIILPETSEEQAGIFAERLRQRVQDLPIEWDSEKLSVTISIGICEFDSSLQSHEQWISACDDALYSAKEGGRNQVAFAVTQ